jgi:hypothetical protein
MASSAGSEKMTGVHTVFSWLDITLLLSLVYIRLGDRFRFRQVTIWIGIVAVAIMCLLPISGLSLFMYPRGVIGDLSMTTKVYLTAWLLFRSGRPKIVHGREINFLLKTIAAVGVVFYPLSLGLTSFDPYSAGFSASILIIWTVIAAAYGLRKGYYIFAVAMLTALWGYLLGLMESDNLLDYLFDPLLFIYAAYFTCVKLIGNRNKNETTTQE